MSSNRVNTHFTAEQREEAKAALAALAARLPFLIDLTSEERAAMPRFGDKSRGFISKALDIAENNPEILPRTFNLDEFRTDVEVTENLYAIRSGIETLLGRVNDTWFAAGSEAYAAALLVYQYAKIHHVTSGALDGSLDDPRAPLRPQGEQERAGRLITTPQRVRRRPLRPTRGRCRRIRAAGQGGRPGSPHEVAGAANARQCSSPEECPVGNQE
jgi:hypothetical protein